MFVIISSYGQNRLGLVTFDENAKIVFNFNMYQRKEDLLNAMHVERGGGRTNTQMGLDFVGVSTSYHQQNL